MAKRLFASITGVLAVVIIITGVLCAREKGNIPTLKTDLTAAEAQVAALTTELVDSEATILALEANLTAAEAQVSTLETEVSARETTLGGAVLPVTFPDLNLEAAIRRETNKPSGSIYTFDLEAIIEVSAPTIGISDLTGLEHCLNLQELYLSGNNISDISALAGLNNLQMLDLSSNNISDISALAGLSNLEGLYLYDNNISDISALVDNAGFSDGDTVGLTGNPLSAEYNIYIPQLEEKGAIVYY